MASKKSQKRGGQTSRAQQQEAAARRRGVGSGVGRDRTATTAQPRPEEAAQPAASREQVRRYLDVSAVIA